MGKNLHSPSFSRTSQHAWESNQRFVRHRTVFLPPPQHFSAWTDIFLIMSNTGLFHWMSRRTFKLPVHIRAESLMRKIYLLITRESHFCVIALWLFLAALFLCVKPAQLLHFLLSSLWCRQMHQSSALSSNCAPLTVLCQAGTCLIIHRCHWWLIQHNLFFTPGFLFIAGSHCWRLADDLRTSNPR